MNTSRSKLRDSWASSALDLMCVTSSETEGRWFEQNEPHLSVQSEVEPLVDADVSQTSAGAILHLTVTALVHTVSGWNTHRITSDWTTNTLFRFKDKTSVLVTCSVFLQGGAREFSTSSEYGHGQGRDRRAAPDAGDPVSTRHLVVNQPIGGQGLHCCCLTIGWRDLGAERNYYEDHNIKNYTSRTRKLAPLTLTDLLVRRLAQDGRRVEPDLLLFGAHEGQAVPLHVDQVGIHAGDQRGLDHGPVLRVLIDVPDVSAAPRSHETWRDRLSWITRSGFVRVHGSELLPVARSCPKSCVRIPTMISMVAWERKFFSQKALSQPSLRAFCHACRDQEQKWTSRLLLPTRNAFYKN